jgi:hypothetical protein
MSSLICAISSTIAALLFERVQWKNEQQQQQDSNGRLPAREEGGKERHRAEHEHRVVSQGGQTDVGRVSFVMFCVVQYNQLTF